LGKRSRKRTSGLRPPKPPPRPARPEANGSPRADRPRRPSRSERKDAAAREALVPLREGERPLAVTIGAVVAAALALANLIAYLAGLEISGERPAITGILSYTALMLTAAIGMWRAKYWAVLGMEAILGLLLVIFVVLLFTASNAVTVLISLAIVVPAGALFWFLIKAMARIQMPDRAPR
jgi:hypothetical protein